MKKKWEQLAAKIDALSLRERAILLTLISAAIILLVVHFLIEPQFTKQKMLSDNVKQEQLQISALQVEIEQRIAGKSVDPDAESKRRLASAQQTLTHIDNRLHDLQKNLVRPEKMAALLEGMLRRNHSLQLISLKSLPVMDVMEESRLENGLITKVAAGASAATNAVAATVSNSANSPANGSIYKHEVEIVLQGSYLDMLSYMREMENLPEQVYWSNASLSVDAYPKATLTLNLFTLSLDKKWLDL
ncbi:MAG: MSHA biogenesis protein MshJ [Undibacterium sp.]|uniref:MSHA biogenesis protein MshJ n=1 Tax=Undibacterium sp. TaxID=1914977 RepID=UPI00271C82A4|nr:MSHA biogenesis protein MshJ [Undibacterium sp.]MDO8651991.1 MSHA biogenesis protein MshJ [Undibacterium sp.]